MLSSLEHIALLICYCNLGISVMNLSLNELLNGFLYLVINDFVDSVYTKDPDTNHLYIKLVLRSLVVIQVFLFKRQGIFFAIFLVCP